MIFLKIGNVVLKGKKQLVLKDETGVHQVDTLPSQKSGSDVELSTDYVIKHPDAMDYLRENPTESYPLLEEDQLDFSPCVLSPGKIVCIGLNYRSHADETHGKPPETPVLFSKFSDTVTGHRKIVHIPAEVEQLDYEAELGIVIGKRASHVSRADALSHVFGYFPANDVSARDLQFLNGQWLLGKTLPDFAPIGPYITTADEIPDPNSLSISLKLNGEVRQNSNTRDMIFHCDYLISYISQFFPLNSGDIILTGTPSGVVLGMPKESRVWLKSGDIAEIEIEGLGKLITEYGTDDSK